MRSRSPRTRWCSPVRRSAAPEAESRGAAGRSLARVSTPSPSSECNPLLALLAEGLVGSTSGIRLSKVSLAFRNQQVLQDVSWEVKKGERVGLVGVNGAGKTTQLQIIMGNITPDAGELARAKNNMKIAYLKQEFDVVPTRTVREEFQSVFREANKANVRLAQIEELLQDEEVQQDMDRMGALLDELDKEQRKLETLDSSLMDSKIDKMMPELGFRPDDNEKLVASYSGGWQMRMMLGKLLLQEPDLLLLDEPTNHIDLETIEWLEGYLKEQEIPMVIVSHDREFLDQLCTKIVETERGVSTTYQGNYTAYLRQKSERTAQQLSAYQKQQKEINKLRDMVRKLSGGAQSGRAAQAEKQIQRMQDEGLIEKPFEFKARRFLFPVTEDRCGQEVVEVQNLTHGYPGRGNLFEDVSFVIQRGERVAIMGPNGAGKSTMLRLVRGVEKPTSGVARFGPHNIVPNFFEQNQAEALDMDLTVIETLVRAAPDAPLNEIKGLLGQMMFSGTGMEKKVSVLSGGEKARLAMAKFMLTPATLLILDEPTNHLDIPTKEMLESALKNFDGAVIAVSHDRYFLRQIATRVLTVEGGEIEDFEGDYEYFLEKDDEAAEKEVQRAKARKEVEKSNIKAKSKMSKAEKAMLKKQKAREFNK